MHGSTENENSFLGQPGTNQKNSLKLLLDHEILGKKTKDTIVVTPTYYPDSSFVKSDYTEDRPLNLAFAKNELSQVLIPLVEQRYRTYAKTTNLKGLVASRNHRAFGGFSMGAITTWYVFEHQLNLFKYFVPMAGDSWTAGVNGGAAEPKKTAAKLANVVIQNNYKTNNFMILEHA